MRRPWMQLYTRDWLDNKELRRCSTVSRAVLIDLMCLAHEGNRYGFLEDSVGPLPIGAMAHRCHLTNVQFLKAFRELEECKRLKSEDGVFYIPRMVEDERVRAARASGGAKSIGHPNTPPPVAKEGYPYTHPSLNNDSRACMRTESDVVSLISKKEVQGGNMVDAREYPKTCKAIADRFPTADMPLMSFIIHQSVQAYLSVDNPKTKPPGDPDIAAAVAQAAKESQKQTSAGLFRTTVPAIISNWAKFGKPGSGQGKFFDIREITG